MTHYSVEEFSAKDVAEAQRLLGVKGQTPETIIVAVRGEGARLLDSDPEKFTRDLQSRAQAIAAQERRARWQRGERGGGVDALSSLP